MTSRRGLMWSIFAVAIVVRILAIAYFHAYDIPAADDHFQFGYEAGRLARSLATGHGYSSPMADPSGASAFLAPAFPFLLAGIFKLFGIYTTASAVVVYLFNTLVSALTCIVIFRLGSRIFGPGAGSVAALLYALYPPAIWFAAGTIWDTTLITFALVTLIDYLYSLPHEPAPGQLALAGLLMGLIVLINPAPGVCFPFIVGWIWWRARGTTWTGVRAAATVTLCCGIVCVPWMIRNGIVVGEFGPRSAGGINFRLGNNEVAWQSHNGTQAIQFYPTSSPEESRLFTEMGEAAYDRYCTRIGTDFIRDNKQKFAQLTVYRIRAWWFGISSDWKGNWQSAFPLASLKKLIPALIFPFILAGCIAAWRARTGALPLGLVLIYPLPYYFFFVAERYRFPVEPFFVLFAATALTEMWNKAYRSQRVAAVLSSNSRENWRDSEPG